MGISTLGVSVCGLAFVPLTHFLISNLGWRNTLVVLGIIVWGLTVIPGGDYPDPVDVETENFTKTATISAGEQIWTLRGALRTKALWLLLVGFNLAGLSLSGVLIHLFSYLQNKGFSKDIAASAVTVFAFCCAMVKVPWGLISERVPVRTCIIIGYTGCVIGLFILLTSHSVPLVFLYAVVYGTALGGDMVLRDLVWADYYGRTFLGTIRGVIMPAGIISMAGGPLFAAWLYDLTGNCQIPYIVFLIAFLLGAFFIYLATPPTTIKGEDK